MLWGLTNHWLEALLVVLFILTAAGGFMPIFYSKHKQQEEYRKLQEVSRRATDVTVESKLIRRGLQRIANDPDPIKALIKTMTGDRYDFDC